MNKHLNDGQLRAALDQELDEAGMLHLENCPACRRRQTRIMAETQQAAVGLSFLASPAGQPGPDARSALIRFHQRNDSRKEISMFKKLFASSTLRVGLAIVVILAVVFSFPQARAFAGQFLNLFRVQQVVVVPVDFTGMQSLTGNDTLGKQVSDLIASSVTSQQNPGTPVTATDAAQASQLAGFTVRVPQGMTPSRLSVENAAAFTLKVDVAKVQALLNESGRSDLVLPTSINGENVSVNIPASVSVAFGTCPDPAAPDTVRLNSRRICRTALPGLRHPGGNPHPHRVCTRRLEHRPTCPDRVGILGHDQRPGCSLRPNGRLDLHPGHPAPQECRHL